MNYSNWYKLAQIETESLLEKQRNTEELKNMIQEERQRVVKNSILQIESLQIDINEKARIIKYWENMFNKISEQTEQTTLEINEMRQKNIWHNGQEEYKLKQQLEIQKKYESNLIKSREQLAHLKGKLNNLKKTIKTRYDKITTQNQQELLEKRRQKEKQNIEQLKNENVKKVIVGIILESMKRSPKITSMGGKSYGIDHILMPSVEKVGKKSIKINMITQIDQPYQKKITDEANSINLTPETIINDLITTFMHSDLHEIIYPLKQKLGVDRVVLTAYGQHNNPIEIIK